MNAQAPITTAVPLPRELEIGATYIKARHWLAWFTVDAGQEHLLGTYRTKDIALKFAQIHGENQLFGRG